MNLENILIVDDQLPNLKVLATILKEKNYKVRKATDGQSAIEAVQIDPPHLILLDIKMPGLDGYQVCQRLKSEEKTKDIPIIFISALSEIFDKIKAFEVGGIDYITKPFQKEEVLARISSQLTIRKQQELLKQEKEILKQEIRRRKETEAILYQSRALISSILSNSLDGIAALESIRNPESGKIEDFRCLVINPILAKFLNQDPENLSGKLIFKKIIEKINLNLFPLVVGVVETGISLKKDFSCEYKQETKCYNLSVVKLADGFAITVRDITERKQRELELNRLASIDGLTGVYNRRTFDITLEKEWRRAQREEQSLSLILCDVDYFKLYNDSYGHQAGDDCLVQVAQAIKKVANRAADLVGRYGGEEFAIILPNTNRQGAIRVAENIQQSIRTLAIPHQQSKLQKIVSVSLGIASFIPTPESSVHNLVSLADKALYKSKQQGRNRWTL